VEPCASATPWSASRPDGVQDAADRGRQRPGVGAFLFLYLTVDPPGLDQVFGDEEFEPFPAGVVVVLVSLAGFVGLAMWSWLRWIGIGITVLGLVFWVPFVLNTTRSGPAPAFVVLYGIAAVALGVSLWLEPGRTR
jgi:hypothetical protein